MMRQSAMSRMVIPPGMLSACRAFSSSPEEMLRYCPIYESTVVIKTNGGNFSKSAAAQQNLSPITHTSKLQWEYLLVGRLVPDSVPIHSNCCELGQLTPVVCQGGIGVIEEECADSSL